jgi:hypothetical protein
MEANSGSDEVIKCYIWQEIKAMKRLTLHHIASVAQVCK